MGRILYCWLNMTNNAACSVAVIYDCSCSAIVSGDSRVWPCADVRFDAILCIGNVRYRAHCIACCAAMNDRLISHRDGIYYYP